MITNFEEQSKPLTEYERERLLPEVIGILKNNVGKVNASKGMHIISRMTAMGYNINDVRLRKLVNHIRCNNIIPCLVSTKHGYFIATMREELDDCISSLQGRADAILAVKHALERQRGALTE